MRVKMEAAYHEAGHVVSAWFSRYHTIASGFDLAQYGVGGTDIAVSKRKMSAADKSPIAEIASNDRDVVFETAVIFMAGYQAELIAAETDKTLIPNRHCADLDYQLAASVFANAGMSSTIDQTEKAASDLLRQHWYWVERVAQAASIRRSLTVHELIALLP